MVKPAGEAAESGQHRTISGNQEAAPANPMTMPADDRLGMEMADELSARVPRIRLVAKNQGANPMLGHRDPARRAKILALVIALDPETGLETFYDPRKRGTVITSTRGL